MTYTAPAGEVGRRFVAEVSGKIRYKVNWICLVVVSMFFFLKYPYLGKIPNPYSYFFKLVELPNRLFIVPNDGANIVAVRWFFGFQIVLAIDHLVLVDPFHGFYPCWYVLVAPVLYPLAWCDHLGWNWSSARRTIEPFRNHQSTEYWIYAYTYIYIYEYTVYIYM